MARTVGWWTVQGRGLCTGSYQVTSTRRRVPKSGNPDPGRQISAKGTKARGQTGQTETGEPATPLSLGTKGRGLPPGRFGACGEAVGSLADGFAARLPPASGEGTKAARFARIGSGLSPQRSWGEGTAGRRIGGQG